MSVRRQLTRTDCYHGNIGRKNAEEELRKSIYEVGTFLIRSSTDKPNYALSLKSPLKQSIAHYLILWHGPIYQPFYSIEGGPLFPNISQLISFYTRSNEGLPCTLGFSVISNPMPRLQQPPAYPETLIDKIHVAAFAGDLTTIQELVSLNPNCVNIRNAMQCTPLHVACLCCHENVVIELLKAKADVDAVDIRGYTPLMYAATVGHTTICQKLLNDGANLAQRSPVTGRYALHEVAMRGYHNCLQLLLDRGAPLLATSYDNKTPLDIARFWNREECCNILDRESKRETGTMDGDWLHQDISDEQAKGLIRDYGNTEGLFIVIKVADTANPFLLLLCDGTHIVTYPITLTGNGYSIRDGPVFSYLSNMIDYYKKWKDDTLPLKLKNNLSNNVKPTSSTAHLINYKDMEKLGELGSGQYGTVYSAYWHQGDGKKIKVAMKQFSNDLDTNISSDILKEANIMLNLNHPNIVRLLGMSIQPLVLIQELVVMGSLIDHVRSCAEKSITIALEIKLGWAKQIAAGMAYVQSKNIVHGDLAARNILMQSETVVKITDFGLASTTDRYINNPSDAKEDANRLFPIRWYAFESLFDKVYTSKSDVWSFGVLLWEVFSDGQQPYKDIPSVREIMDYLIAEKRLILPRGCPTDICNIMNTCWKRKPEDRPTFAQLQQTIDELIQSG